MVSVMEGQKELCSRRRRRRRCREVRRQHAHRKRRENKDGGDEERRQTDAGRPVSDGQAAESHRSCGLE